MNKKRKPITAKEMEAAYQRCLKREYDRERKWKKTKQGAFESAILRLDKEAEEARECENSVSWLSDHGKGARQMYRALDLALDPATERQRRINRAKHLVMRNMPKYAKVLWLVLKFGNDRKSSIWELTMDAILRRRKSKPFKRPSTGAR